MMADFKLGLADFVDNPWVYGINFIFFEAHYSYKRL